VSLWLRGYFPQRMLGSAAAMLAFLAIAAPHARADDAINIKGALDTRLAYVVTGLPELDETSKAGLMGVNRALRARTSYEPQDPVGVDIARDDLAFYPLLYWPMDPREKNLTPAMVSKLNDYMRLGGTILFDTRDLTLGAVRGANSPGQQTLRRITQGLDLPPLGRPGNNSGNVVTKTLLIIGEKNVGPTPSGQRGAMLRAYDKRTGKEVGAVYMPAPQSGSPMTYMLNGKQYVIVAISGGTYSGEILAFKLP